MLLELLKMQAKLFSKSKQVLDKRFTFVPISIFPDQYSTETKGSLSLFFTSYMLSFAEWNQFPTSKFPRWNLVNHGMKMFEAQSAWAKNFVIDTIFLEKLHMPWHKLG